MAKPKDKTPSREDAKRCLDYREKSRTGTYIPSETKFCEKMLRLYPDWYRETQAEVFNNTVPAGSNVRYEDIHK